MTRFLHVSMRSKITTYNWFEFFQYIQIYSSLLYSIELFSIVSRNDDFRNGKTITKYNLSAWIIFGKKKERNWLLAQNFFVWSKLLNFRQLRIYNNLRFQWRNRPVACRQDHQTFHLLLSFKFDQILAKPLYWLYRFLLIKFPVDNIRGNHKIQYYIRFDLFWAV